jgi:ribose transport system ATP-binding protein
LRNCSFAARSGEVHAIVGANGSGKSTLAKIISGVARADSGAVKVFGKAPRDPREAAELGVATIFQEVLVADEMSVADNLHVGRDGFFARRMSSRQKNDEAREVLKRIAGINVDPSAKTGTLPLSVKQWIVICRAILRQPRLLILDESSAALDLDATVRLHAEIERLRAGGTCVIIVTHRIAELVRIADRATILRDGVTVGILEKTEISEEGILDLMMPSERDARQENVLSAPVARGQAKPVLKASSMRLRKGAAPFDFCLQTGMIVGVTGLEGQGQDQFVMALAGITAATEGETTIHTVDDAPQAIRDLTDADRLRVSYVSGDRKLDGIFPGLSIFENFALAVYRRNSNRFGLIRHANLQPLFARETKRLSVKAGHASNRITSLSGGNQQKVLIGRAFAQDPRVIILNDPARGVDIGTKRDLYRELRAFADAGGAVVYLSNEIEEFSGFADRVEVFVKGSLFRTLSGGDIAEAPILAAMFGQEKLVNDAFVPHEAVS